ncbi:MAG: hypothetical protein ABIR32_07375 [Ilumatobacteraceae bacterium]
MTKDMINAGATRASLGCRWDDDDRVLAAVVDGDVGTELLGGFAFEEVQIGTSIAGIR